MKYQFPDRREGLFQLGERVTWTSAGVEKRGEIVEVVKWGRYPETRVPIHGFYREHFSYVVKAQDGRFFWPWVGTLRRIEP